MKTREGKRECKRILLSCCGYIDFVSNILLEIERCYYFWQLVAYKIKVATNITSTAA